MKSKVILLVEDNRDDEILTLRALQQHQVRNEIVVARDGLEALDYLFKRGEHANRDADGPQCVLLDLQLPKIEGLDVLKAIRADERTQLLPVVIFTSSDAERDIVQSYELGANGFVRKPLEFEEFQKAVEGLGLYWLLLNERAPLTE